METHFIGIDIGKKRLDVAIPVSNTGYHCIGANNDLEGFKKIVSELEKRKADLKKKKMDVQFGLFQRLLVSITFLY